MAAWPCTPALRVTASLFLRRIPFAVSAEGPSPVGRHHHRLQVILAREALRHGMVVAGVVVYLLADDRPASDEVLQRLLRQRSRMPFPVVAGLALLRGVDAEQSYELRAELNGIAIDDLKARPRARSDDVVLGLRMRRNSQKQEKQQGESPHCAVLCYAAGRSCRRDSARRSSITSGSSLSIWPSSVRAVLSARNSSSNFAWIACVSRCSAR